MSKITKNYEYAKEQYAAYGVDTDAVLEQLKKVSVSLHCWQGDDVGGFEVDEKGAAGGILVTGNYMGVARTPEELRADYEKVLSLLPGKHRASIHAKYLETNGKPVDRDAISYEHFAGWVDWANKNGIALDFNSTFYAHKLADNGLTLSNPDEKIRGFWVEHAKRSRAISAEIGKNTGKVSVDNLWIPDGFKDVPASRLKYRELLTKSLDEIFTIKHDPKHTLDSIESKLFGIGAESYTVGSHEYYMGYAMKHNTMLTYDMGHYHQTESIADKISATLLFIDKLLVHVSRPVRWDSDHVVLFNDDLVDLMKEIKRCNAFDRIYLGLDFFDASINRLTAWITGSRATLKAVLFALLEPTHLLTEAEDKHDYGTRLALNDEFKALPWGAVWDMYCEQSGVPAGSEWINEVLRYEKDVLAKRV